MRLNNSIRCKLKSRIIEQQFAEQLAQVEKLENETAVLLYQKLYAASTRSKMNKLPKGWLETRSSIYVQAPQPIGYQYYGFKGDERMMFLDKTGRCSLVVDSSDKRIMSKLKLHYKENEQYKSDVRQAKVKINSLLNEMTTIKKLIDVWPECEPFLDGLVATPSSSLPAVPVKDLNKLLGLKKRAT